MVSKDKLDSLVKILKNTKKVVISTGAGISAESGIPTFRGKDGLWKKYRAEELATPQAFRNDPKLVWEWYEWRRSIIGKKNPNPGHKILAQWEKIFPEYTLITQNIDGLHQKAGSTKVLELHGNIWKTRCTKTEKLFDCFDLPLKEIPPVCPECGAILRPHVVWFGESLPHETLHQAFQKSSDCEVIFVVGTSAFVQPAASLPLYAAEGGAKIVEININSTPLTSQSDFSFLGKAGEILPLINNELGLKPS